jgi:hypothetical protein
MALELIFLRESVKLFASRMDGMTEQDLDNKIEMGLAHIFSGTEGKTLSYNKLFGERSIQGSLIP